MLISLAVAFGCIDLSLCLTCAEISLPDIRSEVYSSVGDINFGALFSITDVDDDMRCTTRVRKDLFSIELIEAIAFAVKKVNENRFLLPKFRLGFYVLDYCENPNIALAQSLSFLPAKSIEQCQQAENDTDDAPPLGHYDVIGVIGPDSSMEASLISNLYSVAKLPLLTFMASSNTLSDKVTHPYFFRVVPNDLQQVLAMLSFMHSVGWSYISIVYDEGAYGQNAFEHFNFFASHFGICFALVRKVSLGFDHDQVVKDLLRFPTARVVVIFGKPDTAKGILQSSTKLGSKGHFIWVVSDAISDRCIHDKDIFHELIGAIVFTFYMREVEEFTKYFNSFRWNSSTNPWLKSFWELQGECKFEDGSCEHFKNPTDFPAFINSKFASLVMDSVLTYAHGTHGFIKEVCPFANKSEVRRCIKGDLFMKYLLSTSFDGYTDRIKFDSHGDYIGKYEIRQVKVKALHHDNTTSSGAILVEEAIALYDTHTRNLIFYVDVIVSWDHLAWEYKDMKNGTHYKKATSICSMPCDVGEYRVLMEVPCCWTCRRCRVNERVVGDGAGCETCEEFTWPDSGTELTTCRVIAPEYTSIYAAIPMAEVCLAAIAIVGLLVVIFFYINNNDHRVIKASSRELSYLQMTGILFGYISVIMFQMKPSDVACGSLYFLYCMSFAWLYSPLIVKTVRIYRIFECAKHNVRPHFVSPQAQLFFASVLIAVQVFICVMVYIHFVPRARKTHPNPMEKYVELSCDMTVPGLASFLAYNLFLVALCSYFAFKTRRLPENFNESLFISMCVSTTLIIWLSFIATYLTASRGNVRVLLLSMSLLLNHTVAIVFLFIPKIYAVIVVDPTTISTFSPMLNPKFNTSPVPRSLLSIAAQGSKISVLSLAKHRQSCTAATFSEMQARFPNGSVT